jgi:hypothetical protein
VGLWRTRSSKTSRYPNIIARPIDAEIDMRRPRPTRSKLSRAILRLLRWMLPEGDTIAPPKRSIARELEEEFPSNDY